MYAFFKQHFFSILRHSYFRLNGRASQGEYWIFVGLYYAIFCALVFLIMILAAIGALVSGGWEEPNDLVLTLAIIPVMIVILLLTFGCLPPMFAAFVRRLHDTGRSGWWLFLSLLPFGILVLVIFTALPSQPGTNKYGPNPNGVETPVAADVFV